MRFRILAALAFTYAAVCQTLPPGVQKKASVGGITEYEYPNGLRVLLYPDAANPKITVNMIVQVGSRHEGYGETGMAHLLEHMDFIETNDGRQIKNEIVAHGSVWNGTTSEDRTNYYETFTASDENLKWALDLEAARLVNVKINKQLLDVEMTVVRNEFERGENSPQRVLSERVASTAFLWHNYGKSTIGSREDLEKVPAERLLAFYKKYYQPDNAVVAIGGKLDEAKTLQYVADTLGRLPRPTRKLDQTYTVEPTQDGMRYVELRRVGEGQELIMAYHMPAAGHPDSAALQVLSGVMSGGGGGRGGRGGGGAPQGRLTKALVENKKAESVSMRAEQLHDPGLLSISASLSKSQSIDEVRKIVAETLKGIISEPPTKDEVERVKTRMARNLEQQLTDAQQVAMGMTTPVSQGDWRLMFLQHDRIQQVSPEDLVRVAKAYLKDSNLTVGVFIPDGAPDRAAVPDTPELAAMFRNYKSSIEVSRAEEFDPTPANIEKRVVRSKLANGMKVAMLPKKMAGGTVSVAIELHFGDAKSLAGKNAAAQLAGSLLMSGTRTRNRQQIQDEMEKLNARIQVSGGGGAGGGRGGGGRGGAGGGGGVNSASASITVKPENLPAAMRLAVEMLREPAYPEVEFDRVKGQRVRALENVPTQPEQLSAQELQRYLSPFTKDDPQYQATREEQLAELKAITLADVKKFHDQFYGASHGEFIVVGDVDRAAVQKLAAELLGEWTTPGAYTRLSSPYKQVAAKNQKIETPDKENAQFEAGMRLKLNESDADYSALVLANYMFGGSITARMPNRIRNREGLSYGASSRFTAPTEGDAALFSATVSCNPVNMPKVEASFLDELKKTVREGFTQAELDEAKRAYADARKVARSQESALVTLIASHEQLGRTLLYDEQQENRIRALTLEQVNAAFRKHMDPAGVTIVKAGDFKKAAVYQ
ncbi:MAG: pitrilysin family protein [Candidatus Solibacter sp.]